MKDYGWVTQIDGEDYFRHIDNPLDEIVVRKGKKVKLTKSIKELKEGK